MRLIISDIPEEGMHRDLEVPLVIHEGAGPVVAHISFRAIKFGKKVLIDGSVRIHISFECSRCLKGFSRPLDIPFKGEFNPAEESAGEGERELGRGELDLDYYNDDEIDIEAFVKEQVFLALPMKPVCSADCRGMCPVCGTDLNEGSCSCKTETGDPRLAPLEKLKEKMKERKE